MTTNTMGAKRDWLALLRKIHSWTGLVLCVPLALLGITGSILVFDEPIERMLAPSLHHASEGTAQPAAAVLNAAQAAAPAGMRPTLYIAPSSSGDSAAVRFGGRGGPGFGSLAIYVDPVSLTVLGSKDTASDPLRLVHSLHENLASGSREGREVVGWLGVAMTLLCLTGPFLWWPRNGRVRAALTMQPGIRGYRFYRELHGVVGIWGVFFFTIVCATGIYLGFPQTITSWVGAVAPTSPPIFQLATLKVAPMEGEKPLDIDAAIALARDGGDGAGARLRFVSLPQRPDQPMRIAFNASGQMSQVVVDQWRHTIMLRRDSGAPGDTILSWLRGLHVGSVGGWPYQVVVFAVGFLPPLFAFTGVAMWLAKRRARRASSRSVAGAPAE
jgi:uncharacterized iron-regulated membrane protein